MSHSASPPDIALRANGLPSRAEVIVIGGGVQGSSIAYSLRRRGIDVVLLETHSVSAGASGASAGGVRHQGRDLREFPLAFRAIERWRALEAELDADLGYRRDGHLTLIEDEGELPALQASVATQVAHGLEIRVIEGDELRSLVPSISPAVVAGAFSPNDGHANPTRTALAFAQAAQRLGARICEGVSVTSIELSRDSVTGVVTDQGSLSADMVVLAAGAWSTRLAAGIGLDLPLEPLPLQAMTTVPGPQVLRPVLGSTTRLISLKQLPGGRFLLGGGWPGSYSLDQPRGRPTAENIAGNVAEAVAILPAVAEAAVDTSWIGIEALAIDEVPILGAVPGRDGIVLATGFSGHGFALSPAVGEAIAELIATGVTPSEITPLTIDRFERAVGVEPLVPQRAG